MLTQRSSTYPTAFRHNDRLSIHSMGTDDWTAFESGHFPSSLCKSFENKSWIKMNESWIKMNKSWSKPWNDKSWVKRIGKGAKQKGQKLKCITVDGFASLTIRSFFPLTWNSICVLWVWNSICVLWVLTHLEVLQFSPSILSLAKVEANLN